MKTVNVKINGENRAAYYEKENDCVRVWDEIAGHYVMARELSDSQIKRVKLATK